MHFYENLPMNVVGYILAAFLIGFHLWMIVKKQSAKVFLQGVHRNDLVGAVLMAIGMLWFWLLVMPGEDNPLAVISMNLGEFEGAKKYLVVAIPVAAYFMITEVKEYLAVRGAGLILLMSAAPILYSCFQIWPTGKLLLPIYAYAMITAALFMVGMPYLFRDLVSWVAKDDKRWLAGAFGGLAYGVAVLACSILYWG